MPEKTRIKRKTLYYKEYHLKNLKFQIPSSKADVDYIFHFPLTLDVKYIAFHTYLLAAL